MNTITALILLVCECVAERQFLDDRYYQKEDSRLLRPYELFDRLNGENRRNADGNGSGDSWHGRWMPDRPDEPIPPPKIFPKIPLESKESFLDRAVLHGVTMGYPSPDCDDAKTNLTVDWTGSPTVYTCYQHKFQPDRKTFPTEYCEHIPKNYVALHKCMNEKIEYDDDIPLYGSHRPLWPIYGEYKFLPRQRWLHSLEHGAIVALYHPCANPLEVKRFKRLVTGCLRRHVITPYNLLSSERPFALVAWGCRLTMAYTDPETIKGFIRKYALKGPEDIPRDGQYDYGLIRPARIVSDVLDSNLCPADTDAGYARYPR
nr:uncharacterized protein LOC116428188 [Nomia melanderi]